MSSFASTKITVLNVASLTVASLSQMLHAIPDDIGKLGIVLASVLTLYAIQEKRQININLKIDQRIKERQEAALELAALEAAEQKRRKDDPKLEG